MTPPLTPKRLAEIEARATAASAGPWEAIYDKDIGADIGADIVRWRSAPTGLCGVVAELAWQGATDAQTGETHTRATASFIAAARTDVPDLVAEVRRLAERLAATERERDEARAEVQRLREALATVREERDSALRTCRDQERARVQLRAILDAVGAPYESAVEAAARVVRELAGARAEVQRLRDELHGHRVHTDRAIDGVRAALPQALAAARADEREASAAMLDDAADAREIAAGQGDVDSEQHADLCQRAAHLRGAAALIRARVSQPAADPVGDR